MPVLQNDFGVFLPLTQVFDPESITRLDRIDPILKEFVIASTHNYNNTANVLNVKETGYYITAEIVNSQYWFKPNIPSIDQSAFRNAFRIVINFGALPNAGAKSVAHNIQGLTAGVMSWTRVYATSTDPSGNGIPIPYSSSTLNENISLNVDLTNVTITTAIDYSAYTTTYVVLEYLKN